MSNVSVKINLRRLQSAQMMMKNKAGELIECVVLPIEANKLTKGEKGVYLDLVGFELKERKPDRKDTHMVKQSLSKEEFDRLSEDEKKALPILGNMVVWGTYIEQPPMNYEFASATPQPGEGTDDDLPF